MMPAKKGKIKNKNKKGKCQRPSSCEVEAEIKSKLLGKYMGTTLERKLFLEKAKQLTLAIFFQFHFNFTHDV